MTRRDDGFTLLESLIALAILGGAVATILPMLAAAGSRDTAAIARLRAGFAAEAILNRVGLDVPLEIGRRAGRLADGSTWSIEIARYTEGGTELAAGRDALLQVFVAVVPARGRAAAVSLVTLRRATETP